MLYLVSAPTESDLSGMVVVAQGQGLEWSIATITVQMLLDKAIKRVKFENVDLKVISSNAQVPAQAKDKLIYGEQGQTRLWIDTKPMAHSRFTSRLAVVVQEIQSEVGATLGYVVAFPYGRILKVAAADLLNYCEAAKLQGKYAIQNMQYVSANGATAAYLKNYEGLTVPIYIQQRKAVNAEKTPIAVTEKSNSSDTAVQATPSAANMFTPEQLEVLGKGRKEGVAFRIYANPAYSPKQMEAILNVLLSKRNPAIILDPQIPEELMSFYGCELAQGADVRPYFNKAYTIKQAVQVKLGVIRGLDVSKYADASIDGDEMEQLRVRMDADMWSGVIAEV